MKRIRQIHPDDPKHPWFLFIVSLKLTFFMGPIEFANSIRIKMHRALKGLTGARFLCKIKPAVGTSSRGF